MTTSIQVAKHLLTLSALSAAVCLGAIGVSQAQPKGMSKPGLWEMTVKKQVADGQDLTAQMKAAQAQIANLPPEQRKMLEQRMGSSMAGGAMRICVTAEMMNKQGGMAMANQPRHHRGDQQCDQPKVSTSGAVTNVTMTCTGSDGTMKMNNTMTQLGDNGMNIKSNVQTVSAKRGNHTMESETEMKWLGADCGTIKPITEMGLPSK